MVDVINENIHIYIGNFMTYSFSNCNSTIIFSELAVKYIEQSPFLFYLTHLSVYIFSAVIDRIHSLMRSHVSVRFLMQVRFQCKVSIEFKWTHRNIMIFIFKVCQIKIHCGEWNTLALWIRYAQLFYKINVKYITVCSKLKNSTTTTSTILTKVRRVYKGLVNYFI